jgi:hypothetical protein
MSDELPDLRKLLEMLDPLTRDDLRRVLIHDQADRDAIASQLLRYRDERGDDLADIIDMLTMHPEARRTVVRMWNVRPLGYSPEGPLYEVLCSVGAVCDPGDFWSYTTQEPDADFYVVTFPSQELTSSGDHSPRPSFVWTEVPKEFHVAPRLEEPPGT